MPPQQQQQQTTVVVAGGVQAGPTIIHQKRGGRWGMN